MKPGSAVEMPGAWKTRKTEPSFPFVSHSPWKSLRDCHIPTAPAMAVFLIGKRNPKTKKGAQPERELELHPFRLILGLENASGYRRLNARIVDPAATPMYWSPSTIYVIGPAFQFWPVLKCQSSFPFCESAAMKAPSPSP